jgi:hypothetical protein
MPGFAADRQRDATPVGELGGVAEQVEKVLTKLGVIREHRSQLVAPFLDELVAVPGHQRSDGGFDVTQKLRDIEIFREDLHPVGLDLGEIENVVDERQEVAAGASDLLQHADGFRVLRTVRFLDQHFAVADNCIQRRSKLMAHRGHELALGLAGSLRLDHGPLEFDLPVLEFGNVGVDADRAAARDLATAQSNPLGPEAHLADDGPGLVVEAQVFSNPVIGRSSPQFDPFIQRALPQQLRVGHAAQLRVVRDAEDLAIVAVGKQDPVVRVEQHEALRDGFDGR